MKNVAHVTEESGTLVDAVTSHLNHPLGRWMFGQTGEADAARFQLNEEQDVVGGETSPSGTSTVKKSVPARTAM